MKRFITATLSLSVFFVGLGAIVESTTASLKSDEKALEIIRKARAAIGGDTAIAGVNSLIIKGQTINTLTIDGADRIEEGETELALQFPDKMIRNIKIGKAKGTPGNVENVKTFDVVVDNSAAGSGDTKKFVIRKIDDGEMKEFEAGEAKVFVGKMDDSNDKVLVDEDVKEIKTADGNKFTIVRRADDFEIRADGEKVMFEKRLASEHGPARHNELLRTTLALLVTAPEGMDVSYSYAGDRNIDGTAVSVVVASFGGASYKLYFDSSSYLPVAISYAGHPGPVMVKIRKDGGEAAASGDVVTFKRKEGGSTETVETFVRFSDYRFTNGVQFPYKWTTSVGGKVTEVLDVTSYEVNPSDISTRFAVQNKINIRSKVKSQH